MTLRDRLTRENVSCALCFALCFGMYLHSIRW